MSIFKIISIDTINHIHQFETNSGKIFKTREEGFKAIIFFSYINVNNQYTEDELINMVLLLTAFQYY